MVSLKSSMNFGMGAMKKRYDIATLVVRACGCQCNHRYIRRHGGIEGAADEAVFNSVHGVYKKNPKKSPL